MKTLQIPVKFQNGDSVYTIKQTKLEMNCHICEGTGRIKYNDKDMKCPECMGVGKFKSDKNIYVVCDEKFIISSTKISIDNNGNITVKYKGRCGFSNIMNRAEENLFLVKEEAQLKCDDLNRDRIYIKVDDIIIHNSFKETIPGINKIQGKLMYYKENNKFEKNIVVDRSKVLLDGYINYLICKMLNIETIRVVVE